jgi:hypothetical protein
MTIALTHPTAGAGGAPVTLALPPDALWADEFAWQQVEQASQYTTTGALVLDAWAKQAGRPITLRGDVDYAWCQLSTLTTLNAWAAQPGQPFSLLLRGVVRTVVFDHAAGAIDAAPVVPYSDPLPEDHYTLTLKFIEV